MQTKIDHIETLPSTAFNKSEVRGGTDTLTELWARTGDGRVVRIYGVDVAGDYDGAPEEVARSLGYAPILDLLNPSLWPDLYDWTVEKHKRLWRYWITTPDSSLSGVRSFVAAAEAGGLPSDWTEQSAEDGTGTAYTACSFSLGMDGARALESEQQALTELASLPGDVHFFQQVAQIDGFTGVEKKSRQPDTLDEALYEPGHLFQTSHPDAASARGKQWTEQNVLDTTGLTLV